MSALPNYRPQQLSLGSLKQEILCIIWQLGSVTVKDVHQRLVADRQRQLTCSSVTTVLNRLAKKGWLTCEKGNRSYRWRSLVSQEQARVIQAYEQLQKFLAVANPDLIAAFADSLDRASVEQFEAIAKKIQALRELREEESCI